MNYSRTLRAALVFLSLVIAFSNCAKVDFPSQDDDQLKVQKNNPGVYISTSSKAGLDCSQSDSTITIQIVGLGSKISLCMASVKPSGNYNCDAANKFQSPDASYVYTAGNDTWNSVTIYTQNNAAFSPGTFTLHVKDNNGADYVATPFQLVRNAVANCNSSSNGACGSANGGAFGPMPNVNLCSAGTASFPTKSGGLWNWSCVGANGGSTATCAATGLLVCQWGPWTNAFSPAPPPPAIPCAAGNNGQVVTLDSSTSTCQCQ